MMVGVQAAAAAIIVGVLIAMAPAGAADDSSSGGECLTINFDTVDYSILEWAAAGEIGGLGITSQTINFEIPTLIPDGRNGYVLILGTVDCATGDLPGLVACVAAAVTQVDLERCIR